MELEDRDESVGGLFLSPDGLAILEAGDTSPLIIDIAGVRCEGSVRLMPDHDPTRTSRFEFEFVDPDPEFVKTMQEILAAAG